MIDGNDLLERLQRAETTLKDMVNGHVSELGFEALRLEGKAEGVRLAISYLEEALR